MSNEEIFLISSAKLRHRAESIIQEKPLKPPVNIESLSAEDTRQMLYELQVHQVELEMQNEELREAHESLEASRAKYFDFYDLSPMGYLTVSKKGLIQEANLTAATMLNLPRSALFKQPISQFIVNEDQDTYYYYRNSLFKTEMPNSCDLRLARTGQPPLWVELSQSIAEEETGEIVSRIILNNITRRKQAEKALTQERERLQTIIDSVDALVYISDMQTHELLLINEYGRNVWGNVIGQKCWKAIQENDGPCSFCSNNKLLTRAGKPDGVYRWVFQNQVNKRWYDIRDRAIQWANGKWVRLEIATDITERMNAEDNQRNLEYQAQQSQKVESLTRMAQGIAHQLNNLLGIVIGNLELASEYPSVGLIPSGKLAAAMNAATRAAEVGGMMLAYLGQNTARLEPINLSECCRQFIPSFFAGMPENIKLEPALPVAEILVFSDLSQVKEILSTLLVNAKESFAERTGTISLSLKTVSPSEISTRNRFPLNFKAEACDYACLEVKDTGCGIAKADIEKLFDPFYSTKFLGRGLGLPVLLGTIKPQGGCVTLESKPGLGSTFRVYLPVASQPAGAAAAESLAASVNVQSVTVLLVEDEPMVREMAATMLKHIGMKVIIAVDGLEAIEIFKKHQAEITCVLCDVIMPNLDGWGTLEALRRLNPEIPIILSSGCSESRLMEGDHRQPPQVLLSKPYGMAALKSAINEAVKAGKKQLEPGS